MCANITNSKDNKIKVVNTESLNFRKGPFIEYEIIQWLEKNTEVEVIPEIDVWVLVRYKDILGFVSAKYLSDKEINIVKKYVNVSALNFRSGPSTKSSIIEVLSKGSQVEEISRSNGWSKIKYNEKEWYVSSKYLSEKTIDSTSATVKKIIDYAKTLLGKKYVWGAEGPDTFDCSGFTWYVYRNIAKISMPRTSKEQGEYGTYVSKKDLKPADLVFLIQ